MYQALYQSEYRPQGADVGGNLRLQESAEPEYFHPGCPAGGASGYPEKLSAEEKILPSAERGFPEPGRGEFPADSGGDDGYAADVSERAGKGCGEAAAVSRPLSGQAA